MTETIVWTVGSVELVIDVPEDRFPSIRYLGPSGLAPGLPSTGALPIAEVRVAGEGNDVATSERLMGSAISQRLRYREHEVRDDGRQLILTCEDALSGVRVTTTASAHPESTSVRFEVDVQNSGAAPLALQLISTLALGGLAPGGMANDGTAWWTTELLSAQNSWFREALWSSRTLSDLGVDDLGLTKSGHPGSRASVSLASRGTWSSGGHLPMGGLRSAQGVLLWQIEHNRAWRWEVGDFHDSVYLVATGPAQQNDEFSLELAPGEIFRGVPVAVAFGEDLDSAFAALTTYRRRLRRPHPDNAALPIIFNDYMNCLMGDPAADKLQPLISAASRAGADYFCIDAGWYAEDGDWWDTVGEWRPAEWRFPDGLPALLASIRSAGMVPGLWVEPEVVGVRSPIADQLPDDAFFQRDGRRVIEAGRHQLDYRHPAVIEHMDLVIDRLVNKYGAGYLKFDYNINITQGNTAAGDSPGAGMLGHNRAYLAWVARLLDRYPGLVIENCSSGGQRMDYAMLAIHPIQSTSDNQDPVYYSAVSASAPTAVTPEQSAAWAYPQPDWSDERNALSVVNALLGRVHLSGRIDLLNDRQFDLVVAGLDVYRELRDGLGDAVPFWPLGLPGWHDDWLALGMRTSDAVLLAV